MVDPLVERVVRRIAQAIHPEKIILFGSRAQNRGHPDLSMGVFVLAPEELEAQEAVANTLARDVSERGVVCYG